jgi:hypothetical protein
MTKASGFLCVPRLFKYKLFLIASLKELTVSEMPIETLLKFSSMGARNQVGVQARWAGTATLLLLLSLVSNHRLF